MTMEYTNQKHQVAFLFSCHVLMQGTRRAWWMLVVLCPRLSSLYKEATARRCLIAGNIFFTHVIKRSDFSFRALTLFILPIIHRTKIAISRQDSTPQSLNALRWKSRSGEFNVSPLQQTLHMIRFRVTNNNVFSCSLCWMLFQRTGIISEWIKAKLSLCFHWASPHKDVSGEWRYSSTHSWLLP